MAPYLAAAKATGEGEGRTRFTTTPINDIIKGETRIVALTAEEHDWLQRHHYPTAGELLALTGASAAHRAGKDAGDAHMAMLYGLGLVQQGELKAGYSVLLAAGAAGALYAYSEGALAERRVTMEGRDVHDTHWADVQLRARLEVARLLGDHRADDLIRQHLPAFDEQRHMAEVAANVRVMMEQIGRETRLRGLLPMGPDPRPASHEWHQLQARRDAGEGSASVHVIVR